MFDDFGRFRTVEETLEHPDNLIKRGNGKTTFDVSTRRSPSSHDRDPERDRRPRSWTATSRNALEMIDRLARSDRVRQSIIRHAFRFFLGRNERLADAEAP